MRYYTKEWYKAMMSFGNADMFEPVIDKEYSDEEIEDLYQDMMEKYVQNERDMYEEPPFFVMDEDDEFDPEDFDPEDFIIAEIDEDGNEINMRHPESIDELKEFHRNEMAAALDEYENREPFDEEEAREEFEENYNDYLEEPDEDIPEWIRDSVDPRLIAMGVLPEKVYRKLVAEEEEMEARFDELDAAAEDALEEAYGNYPDEYINLPDDLDEIDGDSVILAEMKNGDYIFTFTGWDEDGEDVIRTLTLESAEIIEDEGLFIEVGVDEDGDMESNCDLENHELYYENGKWEIHLMFDNDDELKYFTASASDIYIDMRRE